MFYYTKKYKYFLNAGNLFFFIRTTGRLCQCGKKKKKKKKKGNPATLATTTTKQQSKSKKVAKKIGT